MGGKGRAGEGEEKEERGKEGKGEREGGEGREGEGCVMAFGGWTPLVICTLLPAFPMPVVLFCNRSIFTCKTIILVVRMLGVYISQTSD